MARARVLDRHAHETEEVETARIEVGEDSLFKSPVRAPQMFQILVWVKGLEFVVGQSCSSFRMLLHAVKDSSVVLDESG